MCTCISAAVNSVCNIYNYNILYKFHRTVLLHILYLSWMLLHFPRNIYDMNLFNLQRHDKVNSNIHVGTRWGGPWTLQPLMNTLNKIPRTVYTQAWSSDKLTDNTIQLFIDRYIQNWEGLGHCNLSWMPLATFLELCFTNLIMITWQALDPTHGITQFIGRYETGRNQYLQSLMIISKFPNCSSKQHHLTTSQTTQSTQFIDRCQGEDPAAATKHSPRKATHIQSPEAATCHECYY